MGFYLRKSIGVGPIRLNLSKSGLGVSAGVKGARIGVSGSGRSYVHAGRGGLYLRKYLNSSSDSGRNTVLPQVNREPIIQYQNTDTTFPSSSVCLPSTSLADKLVRRKRSIAIYLLMPLVGLIFLPVAAEIAATGVAAILAAIIIFALFLLWPILMWRAWRINRAGSKLSVILNESLSSKMPLNPERLQQLSIALANPLLTTYDKEFYCRIAYLEFLLSVVEDGSVTDDELLLLKQVEELFQLPPEFIQDARADAFRDAYIEAIADRELSAEEEQSLLHIRNSLKISESILKPELEMVEKLAKIRSIRQGDLPIIDSRTSMQKSEICHYETEARILKEKNLNSFRREGQKYIVRGLVLDKEGIMLVTNKRLLILHQGTTSIPLSKMLDMEVDYDQNLLTITKDGARSPIIVTAPDIMKAGAILAKAANQ